MLLTFSDSLQPTDRNALTRRNKPVALISMVSAYYFPPHQDFYHHQDLIHQ